MALARARPRTRVRRPGGYTLTEVVLVVALIGTLASLSMPVMSGLNDVQLVAEAEALSTQIYNARRVAISLKRCVLVQAGTAGPTANIDGATAVTRIRAREEITADCETTGTITNAASWSATPVLPDLAAGRYWVFYARHGHTSSPMVWRPSGFSRGNGDSNLIDGQMTFRVVDTRNGNFIEVRSTHFGQSCTGKINQTLPALGC